MTTDTNRLAGSYVSAIMTYGSAVASAEEAKANAWAIACSDLAGKEEEAVTAYFEAASDALKALNIAKTDPRRVAVRNHKSVLLGTLKRGVAINSKLSKGAQEQLNAAARKAKAEANGSDTPSTSPGTLRKTIANATYAECFAAFRAKVEGIENLQDRVNVIRGAIDSLNAMLPKKPKK